MFLVWGSAVIDDRMQYVKIGQKVRITFEGHTKNKKNQQVNLFKVEVAKGGHCSDRDESGSVAVKEEKAPKGAGSSIGSGSEVRIPAGRTGVVVEELLIKRGVFQVVYTTSAPPLFLFLRPVAGIKFYKQKTSAKII